MEETHSEFDQLYQALIDALKANRRAEDIRDLMQDEAAQTHDAAIARAKELSSSQQNQANATVKAIQDDLKYTRNALLFLNITPSNLPTKPRQTSATKPMAILAYLQKQSILAREALRTATQEFEAAQKQSAKRRKLLMSVAGVMIVAALVVGGFIASNIAASFQKANTARTAVAIAYITSTAAMDKQNTMVVDANSTATEVLFETATGLAAAYATATQAPIATNHANATATQDVINTNNSYATATQDRLYSYATATQNRVNSYATATQNQIYSYTTSTRDAIASATAQQGAINAQATATMLNKPLYQAKWTNDDEGWATKNGWKAIPGLWVNDGSSADTGAWKNNWIAAPYKSTVSNYAVEAQIQLVRPPGCGSFGIVARGGYEAGIHICGGNAISIRSKSGDVLHEEDYTIDNSWHLYRFEVQGNSLKVLIDGKAVAQTVDNSFLSGGVVGLWSDRTQVNVRSFKVFVLQ